MSPTPFQNKYTYLPLSLFPSFSLSHTHIFLRFGYCLWICACLATDLDLTDAALPCCDDDEEYCRTRKHTVLLSFVFHTINDLDERAKAIWYGKVREWERKRGWSSIFFPFKCIYYFWHANCWLSTHCKRMRSRNELLFAFVRLTFFCYSCCWHLKCSAFKLLIIFVQWRMEHNVNRKFFVSEHASNTHSQIHKDNNNKYITRTYFISHTLWEFFKSAFIAVTYTKTTKTAGQDKKREFSFNFYWFMISKERHRT